MKAIMRRFITITFLTLLAISALSIPLQSEGGGGRFLDVKDFTYTHLGKTDGVSNQRIFSLCQTRSGAVWWSSKTGVGRFNGSVVKNYNLGEGTRYGHLGGRVIQLVTDSTALYAFDNRGFIFKFNPVQDCFQLVASLSEMVGHEVGLNDICLSDDGLYLGLHDGVWLLQGTTLRQVQKSDYVNCIVKVLSPVAKQQSRARDRLLFCTRSGVWQLGGKQLLPYNIESAYYDELSGKLWLGRYENGLNIVSFDATGRVSHDQFVRLTGDNWQNPIRSICPYDDKTMLIGIDGLGVWQMPRDGTGQGMLLFNANDRMRGVLHGNGVYSIIVDNWKNIVVGTYSGGIDIARPVSSTAAVFRHIANNTQSLPNDHVNMVMALSEHRLMMGTDNGISFLDTETGTWQHSCQGTVAVSATKKPGGGVLVSTYGKGVLDVDAQGNVRQAYSVADGRLTDDHVYATCYDRDGALWIGSLNGDLIQQTDTGSRYYPVHDVQAITQLADGQIAVGTAFGLKLITPGDGSIKELNYAPSGVTDVNPFVNHLLARGLELWIATDGGGVYVYHYAKHESRQLTTADGLPSNHVSSLAASNDGRVWIATEEGLAFVPPQMPPKAVNANYCYGLDREYARGAVANLPDGSLLFGTTTGALIVRPEKVQLLNYTANLQFLGVSNLEGQDEEFNEQVRDMLDGGVLRLGYSQRTCDLHFESVNMRYHYDIVYRYKVGKGEWSQPIDHQYIRFTNLEPGRHRLVLQCVSATTGSVIDTKELTIVIAQPWWNSWWMWCVYIALVALLFYGAWMVYKLHEKYMRLSIDYLQLTNSRPDDGQEVVVSSETGTDGMENGEKDNDSRKDFVDKATRLIADHLSDSDFTIDQLCRDMAMSRTLFYVKLKSYTGKSPQDFIRIIRLERAAALLRSGHNVTDAATLTGFDNPKYFSTVFKKYFNVSPSKYQ